MSLFIGLLTALLVIDCLLLILLVLVQLPKKEAGAGLAFGSGAADALFGAGAGNPLTKITKFAAITFFALLIVISLLQKSAHGDKLKKFTSGVEAETKAVPTQAAPATAPAPAPAVTPAATAVTNAVTK
ncbi:MAG: preprotein translocase subunit SecG [Verrucomicrobia bacterium]|jgi:preprotein translocase subunit SecG|nr:MAG: preprotein translocase subunit SecG [Verrucomicrobiota bacterium]